MQAMKERDDEIPFVDYVQIDDAYWGGVRRGIRGRGVQLYQSMMKAILLVCVLAL